MRQVWKPFLGFMAVFIGISIIVDIIGFGDSLLGPLFLFGVGVILYFYVHRWLGLFFFVLASIVFFTDILDIDIAGIIFAALFIYIGFKLLKNKGEPSRKEKCSWHHIGNRFHFGNQFHQAKDWLDEEIEQLNKQQQKEKQQSTDEFRQEGHFRVKTPKYHSSLIGDMHLMSHRFELNDMNFSYGIGDVKIDLSKAIIPEGESTVVISGLIGDVDIYIPYDLQVSISASATIGDLEILGYKQSGFNRQIHLSTNDYELARRKVKISVSSFIGDIDVRYI